MAGYRRALVKFSTQLISSWRTVIEILERISGRNAFIVCVSEQCKKEVGKFYGLKVDTVINNCIDVEYFKPVTMEERLQIREKLNLPVNKHIIIFIARLEIGKGVDILLKVIRKKRKDWFFYVICAQGNSYYESCLINNGNVKIEKRVPYDTIAERYQASDVFFLPSRYEGFEFATIEALSCGLPIVGYEVGAMKELKYKYGVGSDTILSQESRIDNIINALEKALSYAKDQKYKDYLRNIAVDNFSLASFNTNWNKYIEEVISR
jgi:glycosyltransferase involved in cell wall biosynthesis